MRTHAQISADFYNRAIDDFDQSPINEEVLHQSSIVIQTRPEFVARAVEGVVEY